MLTKKFGAKELYFFGFLVLVTGLPLSKFFIGLSSFILFAAWLWSGDFLHKIQLWYQNKFLWLFTGIFALHLLALFYTRDFDYALNDLRIKLPLFVLPMLIASGPILEKKHFLSILWVFIWANFLGTLASMFVLLGFSNIEIHEIRNISLFTSHIRFGLLICFSIFILGYFFSTEKQKYTALQKIMILFLMLWFVIFLVILESITGISVLVITTLILLLYHLYFQREKKYKILFTLLFVGLSLGVYFYINHAVVEYYKINQPKSGTLALQTKYGNLYEHTPESNEYENGNQVWIYVCKPELKSAWAERSSIAYDANDRRGQLLLNTLVRFLASKGLKKDRDGVEQLSHQEIQSIENGIANVNYQGISNLNGRIHQIIWEYDHYKKGGDPSGHSVVQRFEYWKTAYKIVSKNPWIGVGTGNVEQAFLQEYYESKSPLSMRWRLRSHNQYLTFAVAFGLIGAAYFLFVMFYALFSKNQYKEYLFSVFWIMMMLSMLSEDTLETQAGVSFFAFFYSLFMFKNNRFHFD